MPDTQILTLDDENFDEQVGKLEGPILVDFWADWCGPCKAVAPAMRDQRSGIIVNISSGYGHTEVEQMPGDEGSPGVAYGASKAGLDRMTVGLAKELRPFGVSVVSVDPGFTLTEHCEELGPAGGLDTAWAHPMDLPAQLVAQVVCAKDRMAHTGQVRAVAPMQTDLSEA